MRYSNSRPHAASKRYEAASVLTVLPATVLLYCRTRKYDPDPAPPTLPSGDVGHVARTAAAQLVAAAALLDILRGAPSPWGSAPGLMCGFQSGVPC
jgi:hypothetical protein